MATCLRCDGCGNVASEQDEDLDKWWRVERYGQDWVDDPRGQESTAIHVNSMVSFGDPYDVAEDGELEADAFEDFSIAPDITLHFCKAACLAVWSTQASEFEE
jgi:hypothetical protein